MIFGCLSCECWLMFPITQFLLSIFILYINLLVPGVVLTSVLQLPPYGLRGTARLYQRPINFHPSMSCALIHSFESPLSLLNVAVKSSEILSRGNICQMLCSPRYQVNLQFFVKDRLQRAIHGHFMAYNKLK